MADITMCQGFKEDFICPLREHCYRFKAIPDPFRQSYFSEIPYSKNDAKCENYYERNLS